MLEACARAYFDRVTVIAPDEEQSGVGMGLTLRRPLRVIEVDEGRYAVDGTPTDCAMAGIDLLLKDDLPDLVLSGVNRGPNLGHDTYYSGTVAAARQAAFSGIPAVAISLAGRRQFEFDRFMPVLAHLLEAVLDEPLQAGSLLNINIPTGEHSDAAREGSFLGVQGVRGIRATRIGERSYDNAFIEAKDPRGQPYYWIGGSFPALGDLPGTDCQAILDGYVSVTPLTLDATAHGQVDAAHKRWTT